MTKNLGEQLQAFLSIDDLVWKNELELEIREAEQEALDLFRVQEEKRASVLAHQKWEYLETLAQERWARQQKLLLEEETKRKEQEELIRKEWEEEQKKERLEKEARDNEEKQKRLHYERLMEEMESFIDGTGAKPVALNTSTESNPGREPCQFFTKVGSCRFRDSCSRNHIRPAISHIILIPGFYSHLSLDVGTQGEYDTDINLEFDQTERYRDFEEFFDDITPELEKYGRINTIRVCSNTEPHLRGNVYVAYQSERSAAAAYKALNGRYYAGRMISVEFINLVSWKAAACGLQFRGKCPKGSKCNFLHVFRNPRGQYSFYEAPTNSSNKNSTPSDQDWRWTPSPERQPSGRRSDDWECDSREEIERSDRRISSRRRARSRSNDRHSAHSRLSERQTPGRAPMNGMPPCAMLASCVASGLGITKKLKPPMTSFPSFIVFMSGPKPD
ncbi:hypothetical protein GE061_006962 [Apolygus lucorum]|uniref:Uncharacterized protein n=1 Tax=Apolygus lucorum TaxID=248454 RepID=A0A8S9WRW9_APOLU|nr:hypothetical protein GE061_006962 [Apolygus lucorum]